MKEKRLNEIIESFKDKRIAVLGDLMLDEYVIGKVDRISPEAPVPVVNVTSESFVMGGAANVINNLWSLGAKVYCFGVVGEDVNGEKLKKEFENRQVNTIGLISDKDRPTILKRRIISQNQQLLRLDWEKKKKIDTIIENTLIDNFKKIIDEIDGVIFSDYDKGVITKKCAQSFIDIANEKNKIVIIDPKPSNILNYKNASSITPNLKEALQCFGLSSYENEEEFINQAKIFKDKLGLSNLLITRSENGMTIMDDDKVENIPTLAQEVYDVTGAGDTVISVFTLAKACNASYVEAAIIANVAAGIVVGRVGTSTVSCSEIIKHFDESNIDL